jgi:hypothetical protein
MPVSSRPEGVHRFVAEFAGGRVPGLPVEATPVPVITAARSRN